VIFGDGGNDTLQGGPGDDTLHGGAGADVLQDSEVSNPGDIQSLLNLHNVLLGENGDDSLLGAGHLDGGNGNDTVSGIGVLIGGKGNDLVQAVDVFNGTSFKAELQGGLGHDTLIAPDGIQGIADYSYSAVGVHVFLDGGIAKGAAGDKDTLQNISNVDGSSHNDVIVGDGGDNGLFGGKGDDHLKGLAGNDALNGDAGNDVLMGGPGDDNLFGGTGNDTIYCQAGHDTAQGGSGDDTLYAEGPSTANARIMGGAGADSFIFKGNHSYAIATGGGGVDHFVFQSIQTVHIIDFDPGTEKIDMSALGFAGYADLMSHAAESPDGVNIDLPDPNGHDGTLYLQGLALSDLHPHDFIL